MTAEDFKKGSTKESLMQSILESALNTLISADTYHNFVVDGSTVETPQFTETGEALYEKMKKGVSDVASTIGDAIAGELKDDVKTTDGVFLFDEENEKKYRVPFKTIAALLVAEVIQGAGGSGGLLTATNLWALLSADSDFQIDISHLRDALEGYLTAEGVQGMFKDHGSNTYLSKVFDDEALGLITFLAGLKSNGIAYLMKGFQVGLYQSGITGIGAKVDEFGNGEFESLIVRRFLEVPELRYNRVEVLAGDSWRAPGSGIIESVVVNDDGITGTITLKLEEGEIGNIQVDDICMGIFHDYTGANVNETETTDDGYGNRTFAGFCTSYFRVTSVTDLTEVDGITYYRKVFTYTLRPTSTRWSKQIHPQEFMTFVAYGNFTKTDRQNATYMTPAYTRMLRGLNTWEFSFENIGMQFGDLSILANFDTTDSPNPRAREASTYLFYIDGDIMHTGILRQVDSHGRDVVDYYDQGVWNSETEYFYKDRVYWNGSLWLLVKEDDIDEQGVHHGVIGSEPDKDNPYWLAVVYANTIQSLGHWESSKTPYAAQTIINLGGALYLSNTSTSNPPKGLLKGNVDDTEKYLKDKDGYYFIIDELGISDDWDLLIDLQESVQGEDAIYINLTNDSDSIITDINGVIAAGTEYPITKAQLYCGSIQVTSGITWAVSADGCSATIAPESGVVVTSDMTKDKATVTIFATYHNYTYTKQFTFSKLYGANKYILEPSADVIQYDPNANDGAGEFFPTTLVVRAYCIKNGERNEVTSTSNLGYIKFNEQTYYSGMAVQTNSVSAFTNGRLKFELFDNSPEPKLGDMEEVPLVQNGINGVGTVTINLTNDTDAICTDSDGNIAEDEEYPTTTAELYYQLQKVDNSQITWNCSGNGCEATIDEDGVVTTSNMTTDVASVVIIGAYLGHSYTKTFTFRKLFGAEKYYLQTSVNTIVRDKNGNYNPNSITVRAFCKRFGDEPVECTSALNIAKIRYAGQTAPQYSPVTVIITGNEFTDRHLVFTLIDNDGNIQDTEDIPLVIDGTDGKDGKDGQDLSIKGHWDSEESYIQGNIVRLGEVLYSCVVPNTNKPPHAILKDGVDNKYLKDENDRYLLVGDEEDTTYWMYYVRDGRDGIDGEDGKDGRDGQDGDTPVFINLTNDTDSVVTDMSGTPLESLPTTTAQFFFGTKQLYKEDGVAWGTDHVVGCQVTWDDDGNYTITDMSADRAQVIIKATYNSQFYLRTFSFVKLYGQDKYVLEPEYGTVSYNPQTDTYFPTQLEVYAYVIKNGEYITLTETAKLGYIQYGEQTGYNGLKIPTAEYFNESGLEIYLKDVNGTVRDKEYVSRVSDGKNGINGDDAMLALFDDANIHFICDANGKVVADQSYSTTGSLYVGMDAVPLDVTNSKAESETIPSSNYSLMFGGSGNKDAILTITSVPTEAPDTNIITVTLKSSDGTETRVVNIHVDKVRPGADGESPVVYNVIPTVTILKKKRDNSFSPNVLSANVRKSYMDEGVIKNEILTPETAAVQENIMVYYGYDKTITTIAAATGRLASGNLTPPSTLESYVNFVIAKSDGAILDSQSVGVLEDGESVVLIDIDNENDSMLYDGDDNLISGNSITTGHLYLGQEEITDQATWSIKNKTNITATNNGNVVTVTGISGDGGSLTVNANYGSMDYEAVFSVKKLKGTNKYDIITSDTAIRYNPDTSAWVPDTITVDIYKTILNRSRIKLGDNELPGGFTLTYKIGDTTKNIAPGGTIPADEFTTTGIYIELKQGSVVVDAETIPALVNGKDGTSVSVKSTSTTYAVTDTSTQPADSAFTYTSMPELEVGKYLWVKTVVVYTDGNSTKSYNVSRIGADGNTGKTTHFAYATSSDGKTNFSTTLFAGATYIGTYDSTELEDSTDPTDYTWTKLKGDTGTSVTITSESVTYNISDSGTTAPSSGWTSSVQATTDAKPWLWTKTYVMYSDGNFTTTYCVGYKGKDGVGTVTAYRRAESAPASVPTVTSYNTYKSSDSLGNEWTKSIPNMGTVSNVTANNNTSGDNWSTTTDGGYSWYKSPTVSANGIATMQINFTTSAANQSVTFYLKAYSEASYDFVLISEVGNASLTRTSGYSARTSGNGVETSVNLKCATAGQHFVTVAYAKDGSTDSNGDYGLVRIVTGGLLYRCDGTVESSVITWGTPYLAQGERGTDGVSSTRYYLEVSPNALVKTSGNSWVSSGNITVKAYKQIGDNTPIAAVQGDIYVRYVTSSGSDNLVTISNGTGTITITSLSTDILSLTVYIAKTNSSSAVRLDSVTIPVIANGAEGYEGCQIRTTKWEDTTDSSAYRVAFQNDRGTNKAFKLVDVIAIPWRDGIKDLNGNAISYKPTSGYLWYVCETAHTQAMTWETERVQYKSYWTAMSDPGPMFISFLMAEYGRIEFGTTNEFVVVNSRDEVVAGFTGDINTEDEDSSIRIWGGRAVPGNSEGWSTTLPSSYSYTKYLWTRLVVVHSNVSSDILYTMLADPGVAFKSVTINYAVQSSSTDSAPTSNWQSSMPTGTSSQHLWIRIQLYNSSSVNIATKYLRIRYAASTITSVDSQFVLSDKQGTEPSLAPFRVTQSGKMYASDADINGKITASSGSIGGFEIADGVLQSSGGNTGLTGGEYLSHIDDGEPMAFWAGNTLPTETWSNSVPDESSVENLWARAEVNTGTATASVYSYTTPIGICVGNNFDLVCYYTLQNASIATAPTSGWTQLLTPYASIMLTTTQKADDTKRLWIKITNTQAGSNHYMRIETVPSKIYRVNLQYTSSSSTGPSFAVTQDGALYATNGIIGSFKLSTDSLTTTDLSAGFKSKSASTTDVRLWAGSPVPSSAPFKVLNNGALYATQGVIGDLTITNSGSVKYTLSNLFALKFNSVSTATSGTIYQMSQSESYVAVQYNSSITQVSLPSSPLGGSFVIIHNMKSSAITISTYGARNFAGESLSSFSLGAGKCFVGFFLAAYAFSAFYSYNTCLRIKY